MCVTSYFQKLSIPNSLYIDDRFVAIKGTDSADGVLVREEANKLVYSLIELFTRSGYTLALSKCSLKPSNCKRFLGFLVDSVQEAYILPDDKKTKFIELSVFILAKEGVDVKTSMWWPKFIANKIRSFCLGVRGEKESSIFLQKGFILNTVHLRWPLFASRV